MSRMVLTAAFAVLSLSTLGVVGTWGPASAVWASETPQIVESSLLPKSVLVMAREEGQTPALPLPDLEALNGAAQDATDGEEAAPRAESLSELVARHRATETPDRETECLAGAIYFESKGEPLDGQLAVAQTILNRASSGRFPSSICGVVFQRGQFSFVRNNGFPPIARSSNHWKTAVAIAHVAQNDLWDSSVDNALFFHARHVSPGWRMRRIASVGNHIFYR